MKKEDCNKLCAECAIENKFPYIYCCLLECNEHEFCRGCQVPSNRAEEKKNMKTVTRAIYIGDIRFDDAQYLSWTKKMDILRYWAIQNSDIQKK